MDYIWINACLLLALYSDENIIFAVCTDNTDNMHMVFRLFL